MKTQDEQAVTISLGEGHGGSLVCHNQWGRGREALGGVVARGSRGQRAGEMGEDCNFYPAGSMAHFGIILTCFAIPFYVFACFLL